MSKEQKITLDNFKYEGKGPHLDSPFSIKAIRSLGIEEKDLKKLSLEEYISSDIDSRLISSDLQKERYDNYIKKQEELINKAKEKRNQLKSEEKEEEEKNKNKENETKIYHCELHNSVSDNYYFSKDKMDPNCEVCKKYSQKYEKLKERMKLNFQLEIDNEILKNEKMKKQVDKHKKLENQEEISRNLKLRGFQTKKEKEIQEETERKKRQEDLRISIEKKRLEKEEKKK